jgi:hypothetical protein
LLHRDQRRSKGSGAQNSRRVLLEQLDETVECIIKTVTRTPKPETLQVDDWTVKDTLGHIAFWHESFARNVRALADGRQPDVLEGTYPDLNQRGVERSRSMSVGQIAGRIRRAQVVIRQCIARLPADIMIPYRKGSRDYSPDEHLITVRGHIVAHLHRIEKARRRRSRDL